MEYVTCRNNMCDNKSTKGVMGKSKYTLLGSHGLHEVLQEYMKVDCEKLKKSTVHSMESP